MSAGSHGIQEVEASCMKGDERYAFAGQVHKVEQNRVQREV